MLGLTSPGLNFRIIWAVSSDSSLHSQEALLAQLSLIFHSCCFGGMRRKPLLEKYLELGQPDLMFGTIYLKSQH